MSRVVVYVDGFNLYFGLRSKGWRKYYWLDLAGLARALIKPEQQLEAIHYFTSRMLARFPEKRVIIAQPPGRNSASLCGAASGYFTIGEAKLRGAQLPARIERWNGRALARPDHRR